MYRPRTGLSRQSPIFHWWGYRRRKWR